MPLTRVSYPYNDHFNLPALSVDSSLGVFGNSVFQGTSSFSGDATFNSTATFPSIISTISTTTTQNATNLFVSNQATVGTLTNLGQLTVISAIPGRIGSVIRGAASQSQDMFQVQNSAGANILRVDPSGNLTVGNTGTGSLTTGVATVNYYLNIVGNSFSSDGKYNFLFKSDGTNQQVGNFLLKTPATNTFNTEPFLLINSSNVPLFAINASGEIALQNNNVVPLNVRATTNRTCNITSITGNGSQVTYSCSFTGDNNFVVGSTVTISGASTAGFNGTFTVTAVNSFSFTVSNTTTGTSSTATAVIAQQVADLTQWKNSAGAVLGGTNANAQTYTGNTTTINTQVGGAVTAASHDGTTATITLTSASNLAVGDQVVLSGFTPSGYNGNQIITAVSNSSPFTVSFRNPNPGGAAAFGIVSTPAQNTIVARSAGTIGSIIRGAASQVADLEQWQSSTGTVLASVSSSGGFTVPSLTISGDLTVNGTTTNINTTNLVVEDKNIILGDVTTPSNTTADGGGITLKGATDKTFNWVNSTSAWTSSEPIIANSFIPSSSTVPTNGMYLSAANTLNFATNSTNRLSINSAGLATLTSPSVGSTSGNQSQALILTTNTANVDYLEFTNTRTSAGSDWTTAGYRIQQKVDATWMAYIQFNGSSGSNQGGISFGTGTTTTSAISITERMKIDNTGAVTMTSSLTTGGALNLNYASPTISSNNASTASIFTSTVTGITIGSSSIRTTAFPADGTTSTAAAGEGYMGMPQVSVTSGGRTIAASDAGKHIFLSTTNSQTVTIPANSAVALPVGTTIVIVNDSGISSSIAINTDTLRLANSASTGTRTLASNGMCTLLKIGSTVWIASGNGLT